ncbi:MAG: hypothetical protein EXS29_04250 [Pedosphaera sp.]|nr:hypothetical protein [Pedosphaera sp.]
MDRKAATEQIRAVCKTIAIEMMKIHPAVPGLADKETQDEIYKTLYELTKQVEVIKKRLAKLEKNDDTPQL